MYQHVQLQTSSPVMMVSVFLILGFVMASQIVRTSQMNHLAVGENVKVMNGSVGKSGTL
jgi:F0F1-type ATP synthase assembly protein I